MRPKFILKCACAEIEGGPEESEEDMAELVSAAVEEKEEEARRLRASYVEQLQAQAAREPLLPLASRFCLFETFLWLHTICMYVLHRS